VEWQRQPIHFPQVGRWHPMQIYVLNYVKFHTVNWDMNIRILPNRRRNRWSLSGSFSSNRSFDRAGACYGRQATCPELHCWMQSSSSNLNLKHKPKTGFGKPVYFLNLKAGFKNGVEFVFSWLADHLWSRKWKSEFLLIDWFILSWCLYFSRRPTVWVKKIPPKGSWHVSFFSQTVENF